MHVPIYFTASSHNAEEEKWPAYGQHTGIFKVGVEADWLRRILADLKEEQEDGITIFCDNVSSIALSKNPAFHGRSKHIEIRYHFIKNLVDNGEIRMEFCRSE